MRSRLLHFFLLIAMVNNVAAQSCKYALVTEDGWYKAIDATGRTVADSLRRTDDLGYAYDVHGEGMFPYLRDYRVGFKNARNQLVIPPFWRTAHTNGEPGGGPHDDPLAETRFRRGAAVVRSPGGKYGLIDRRGRLLADTVYDYISAAEPATGAYAARRADTLCILVPAGRSILPPHYRTDPKLYPHPKFRQGLLPAMVRLNGQPWPTAQKSVDALDGEYSSSDWRMGAGLIHHYKVGFLSTDGRLAIDTVFELSTDMLGNSEADYRRYPAPCGFGASMRRSLPRNPDPYYLADDWYVFRGDRCLVRKSGSRFVINTRGDSLYALPRDATRIANSGGFFIFQTLSLDGLSLSSDGLFSRRSSPLYGLVNRQGADVSARRAKGQSQPPSLLKITFAGYGLFLVHSTDTALYDGERRPYYIIDSTGRAFSTERFALAQYAYPGKVGEPHIEIRYANRNDRYSGHVRIDLRGRARYLPHDHRERDAAGREVRTPSAGLAAYREPATGLWGYLDERSTVVIPARYAGALPFVESSCGN